MWKSLCVKCTLFLSDFNGTWMFFTGFRKKIANKKCYENACIGSRVVPYGQTDRRTDGHDEANSHSSKSCESAKLNVCTHILSYSLLRENIRDCIQSVPFFEFVRLTTNKIPMIMYDPCRTVEPVINVLVSTKHAEYRDIIKETVHLLSKSECAKD
jgi:hypothetical protein